MRSIVRFCLSNRPVVLLFALILMASGAVSMFKLNQELLPSIEFPSVYIVTAEPGASPDVVDRDVSQPLSNALTGLPGERHVTTESGQGFSTVAVDFGLDTQLKDDLDAVNQRLASVQLPAGAGKPSAQTFSFSAFPTMIYAVKARDGNLTRATTEAKDVVAPALQGATGVAQIKVVGGEQSAIQITLDPVKLAAAGLSSFQVVQALQGAQVDMPAGETLDGGKQVPVEVLGSVRTVDDLKGIAVGTSQVPGRLGAPVKLADVATVTQGAAPVNGISRTDGTPSLSIQVIRASNGNAVTLSNDVKSRMAKLHLDPNDEVVLVNDTAKGISSSLNDLILEGLLGAVLAIIVIFLFLGSLRATLVTAVSLPTSVLVALLGTQLTGYSLNVLTLAGLTIAVGRIVDDAIVVLENSYRHLQEGQSPIEAALNGATEVSSAVISSTLTTVAVFLPIGLVGGIISRFFLPFSITVTISLLASLLVALTIVPVLVSFFLARRSVTAGEQQSRLVRFYRPALAWSLSGRLHKALVLVVAAIFLAGSVACVALFVPKNFFSFGGSEEIQGTVTLPAGTTTAQTSQALRSFEDYAKTDPDVKLAQVTVASTDYGGFTAGYETNSARVLVELKSKNHSQAALDRLKAKLDDLYGQGNSTLALSQPGPPSSDYVISAKGRDPQALRQASDMIVTELQKQSGLSNVKSNLAAEKPELRVTVDPSKAAAHGLTPRQVGQLVAGTLGSQPLGTLGAGGPAVSILVDPSRITASNLASMPVGPGTTLKDVATVSNDLAATAIQRVDGSQQLSVSATIIGNDVSGISNRANQRVEKLSLPAGVALDTSGGTNADINDSFNSMFVAMGVAVAIVFLILVAFFRSVVTPFVILMTMPLALIGAFFALFLTGQPLGLPALLGVLMVFGIVVSNAILLVDFTERSGRRLPLREALLEAGSTRLRPILMTAVATIAALLPVAAGVSAGGGGGLISQGLAVVVEGGLISSTFLTLLVIPIVYSLLKRSRRLADPGIHVEVEGEVVAGFHPNVRPLPSDTSADDDLVVSGR